MRRAGVPYSDQGSMTTLGKPDGSFDLLHRQTILKVSPLSSPRICTLPPFMLNAPPGASRENSRI